MITIRFFPARGGPPMELACKPEGSLMEAAIDANVPGIDAECGGTLTCATCHVFVREPHASALPPPAADEDAMLEFTAVPRQPASRLSCQLQLDPSLDGLAVDLPPTQT